MQVDIFDYELSNEKVATSPAYPRDSARLLDLTRGSTADRHIKDLPDILCPGDLLVVNDTQVIPSRIKGFRQKAKVEVTLHKYITDGVWAAFARPAKRLAAGDEIKFKENLMAKVKSRNGGEVILDFETDDKTLMSELHSIGEMPLPPYIKRPDTSTKDLDKTNYQSIFAKRLGAVAAPTASLHFTSNLIDAIKKRGIEQTTVTLHVGAGTFLPIKVANSDHHHMHSEWAELNQETALLIKQTQKNGGRIVALGTTALRVLETAAMGGTIKEFRGETNLFIKPGFNFNIVDILITNFHLPRSTLLMLVAALTGTKRILEAYEYAKQNDYRFFSYGDACLIDRSF